MSQSKELAPKELWGKYAEQYAEEEVASAGSVISTSGGVLKIGGDEIPGNRMAVVILDSVRINTLYDGKYDPEGDPSPPTCYAYGRSDKEMVPDLPDHPWFEPQAEACSACPHAEWGSADQGRGKKCQNRRRLAVIPAGLFSKKGKGRDATYELELFDDEEHYAEAEMAFLKLPVTSVKGWAKYVRSIESQIGRPPFGVITEIYLEPNAKFQYTVNFDLIEEIPDKLAVTMLARHEQARSLIAERYAPPMDDAHKTRGKVGLRGLRRSKEG